ncbi:MAG TPA: DNA methyltransferase [Kofleriaceae bacterium]
MRTAAVTRSSAASSEPLAWPTRPPGSRLRPLRTSISAGSWPRDLVLDPFFGSGTTGQVAEKHSRRWIGFDLGYEELAKERTAQRSLALETSR